MQITHFYDRNFQNGSNPEDITFAAAIEFLLTTGRGAVVQQAGRILPASDFVDFCLTPDEYYVRFHHNGINSDMILLKAFAENLKNIQSGDFTELLGDIDILQLMGDAPLGGAYIVEIVAALVRVYYPEGQFNRDLFREAVFMTADDLVLALIDYQRPDFDFLECVHIISDME